MSLTRELAHVQGRIVEIELKSHRSGSLLLLEELHILREQRSELERTLATNSRIA